MPICLNTLTDDPDPESPGDIRLSSTGFWCLAAYWVFSSEVFGSLSPKPEMHIFPDLSGLLQTYLSDQFESAILQRPGAIDAILALGLWLHRGGKFIADDTKGTPNFMAYHHSLTICAVFHPSLSTRNAATTLAGLTLHADPDDADRLRILDDLLENCAFPTLKACAVTWLREEIVLAATGKLDNRFAHAECIESLQYSLFPNLADLVTADVGAMEEYWLQTHPFHLQAANFAYLLLAGKGFAHLVPEGMASAVEERYVRPLLQASRKMLEARGEKKDCGEASGPDFGGELTVLVDRLESLPF